MTKLDDADTVGRCWGILGRKNWVEMPRIELIFTKDEYDFFGDVYDGNVQKRGDKSLGFSLYGRDKVQSVIEAHFQKCNYVVS